MQMFEVMSADTAFNQNEVGHLADQVLDGRNYANVVHFEIKNFGNNSNYTGPIVHYGCF